MMAAFTPNLTQVVGSGPAVTLTENAMLGLPLMIQVITGGILGIGIFQYSTDGKDAADPTKAWSLGLTLGATVTISALGLVVNFGSGLYALGTIYTGSI